MRFLNHYITPIFKIDLLNTRMKRNLAELEEGGKINKLMMPDPKIN